LQRRPGEPIPLRREAPSAAPALEPALSAWWLGQAGFLLQGGNLRILVDPYLSDSLAAKYRGQRYPHLRMTPVPVRPEELRDLDLVLASHGHSDHLDPGTLPLLAAGNPRCRFIVPASCRELAVARGVPAAAIASLDAGGRLDLGNGNQVEAVPAAHEQLDRDGNGHCLYLGFILALGGLRIYHSGDCIPYPGLREWLHAAEPDLAFLPVNGRDAVRAANGIAGNFTLEEAIALVLSVPIGLGIGHHFGMFDFNTLDPRVAARHLESRPELAGRFVLAEPGSRYAFYPVNTGSTGNLTPLSGKVE
jgi:L-ascorbate metabolism protein UlaG (beta-lactamase superfamily)